MKNDANVAVLEAEIAQLKSEIAELKALNKWYEEQFKLAQHRRFGASSEKTENPEQLNIFNEAETTANPNREEPVFEEVTYTRKKKRTGKREEFYEGITTVKTIHELPESERVCPECGGELHACGHDVLRRELEIIPAKVRAVEHVQTVYGCRNCEKNAADEPAIMVKSEVPSPVIPGSGVASPSLLSYIICNKYVLALPLYRQEQEFKRLGINISRQTMANWIIYVATHWLMSIYNLLKDALIKSEILHADETTLQVIKESGRKAAAKSYMWLYRTAAGAENPVVLFEYCPTRESANPQKFLSGFTGYLHADGYQGYKPLEANGVTIVDCWAHARRKFHDALKVLDKPDRVNATANTGYEYCNKLFELEKRYDVEQLSPQTRLQRRLLESKPVAENFFDWADSVFEKSQFLPKSLLGKAIIYARNQKQWLMNVYLDGRLDISNNLAEISVRPFAIGRNNWLFSYSVKGAESSAIVYSIVETAKANGLVPMEYFRFLFETLPNTKTDTLSDFLPWGSEVARRCSVTRS